jgi:polyhydroxyalkanoate synthesis regulator phasin
MDMKSLVMKSVYAGLGVINRGKENVEQLGRRLAREADLSEKDGEKIARRLRARCDRAITTLHESLEREIKKAVTTLHSATRDDVHTFSAKKRKGHSRRSAK